MEIGEIPVNTPTSGYVAEDSFGGLTQVKINALREAIREIEGHIAERKVISEKFSKSCDKMKMDIKNFLLENKPKGEDDTEFARERAELRKKGFEISESQLNEDVECWRDIVNLKRDLRDKQKELFERESRMDTLNRILEED